MGNDIRRPMKLDDWLAQRSQSCPDRTALVGDGAEVTYAELEAEATWVARRLAAHGVRRGSIAALTMHPRREQVVLVHALMKVGATLLPLSPRLTAAERAAIVAAEEPTVDLDDPGELTQTEADLPLLGEHDMDDVCARVLTSGSTGTAEAGRPHLRQLPLERGRLRPSTSASSPPTAGSAACRSATSPASAIVMRSVIYGTTAVLHDGFDVDRVAAGAGARTGSASSRW